MLIASFSKFGSPSKVIECLNTEKLNSPKEDEILVDILAFPINPADLLTIEGKYAIKPTLPSILGAESIAVVKVVGKNIVNVTEGDIVMPLGRNNWCQQKLINKNYFVKIRKKINILQASMLKVNPATAYLMLNNYSKLNKNDWIIQNAANSSVGNNIISLAKNYGVKTINIVRREGLEGNLKKLGADLVIQDKNLLENLDFFKKNDIKLAIDAIGGSKTSVLADFIINGSDIINYGLLSGEKIGLTSHQVIFRDISLKGFWLSLWLNKMKREEVEALYNHLSDLISKSIISVPIEKIYNMEDIKTAVEHSEKSNREGKILIAPNGIEKIKSFPKLNTLES